MIQLPRRSVTRFFIPLIDVLTLLFCIFLLMPLIKATDASEEAPEASRRKPVSRRAEQAKPVKEAPDLEKSGRERIRTLQENLYIRALEIDADTGRLFYDGGGRRQEILDQNGALKLIDAHREEAGARELYYLVLYPRRLTGFPQRAQIERYENWLQSVAHTYDNPHSAN